MEKFTWIPFYTRFATELLKYKNDRQTLLNKLMAAHPILKKKLEKTKFEGMPFDIDPFTVYGIFNDNTGDTNRSEIISAIINAFQINATAPETFEGIPRINNLRTAFFLFDQRRGEHDIDNLWKFFEDALALSENDSPTTRDQFAIDYDTVQKQKPIKWNLSMGLFWVRPKSFLNLDECSRSFLKSENLIPEGFEEFSHGTNDKNPVGKRYLLLCDHCKEIFNQGERNYKDFVALSDAAWVKNQTSRAANNDNSPKYWVAAAGENASLWEEFYDQQVLRIGWGYLGDLTDYPDREAMATKMREVESLAHNPTNNSLATWEFTHVMKPGDIVFVKRGVSEVVGRGIVQSNYEYDPTREDTYKHLRHMEWTRCENGILHGIALDKKTLTDITDVDDYKTQLTGFFAPVEAEAGAAEGEAPTSPSALASVVEEAPVAAVYPAYSEEDFLNEVYVTPADYETLTELLRTKKNLILQGAPGVGKTFAAERLAYSMIGEKNPERVAMVQFHQSYSYEDFILGYRPTATGFELRTGAFYNFCKRAEDDSDNEYFFIIDEINRGNMSKIFGELFMLIEADKRGKSLQLLYCNEEFSVPKNLYIIGMMNTADRSLAMIDYALRRRFRFFELKPGFDSDGFRAYQQELADAKFDALIACVKELNRAIAEDASLGEGFSVGHSYFCGLKPDTIAPHSMQNIVEYELIPLLKEYWFDEQAKVRDWSARLRGALN